MSQVGITFYAGLLDKVVGEFELGEEPEPVLHVLRTLPYGSLIVADILITVLTAIGALLFVIPGLILFTLFAITGPVINIEHVGAIKGMRRSAHLVRPHFWLVFFLVSVPLGVEHQVIHWANELVLHHSLVEVFVVQGITGMIVGSFVGLVEVNVAYALELGGYPATLTRPSRAGPPGKLSGRNRQTPRRADPGRRRRARRARGDRAGARASRATGSSTPATASKRSTCSPAIRWTPWCSTC